MAFIKKKRKGKRKRKEPKNGIFACQIGPREQAQRPNGPAQPKRPTEGSAHPAQPRRTRVKRPGRLARTDSPPETRPCRHLRSPTRGSSRLDRRLHADASLRQQALTCIRRAPLARAVHAPIPSLWCSSRATPATGSRPAVSKISQKMAQSVADTWHSDI